jgi:hypothetical protein
MFMEKRRRKLELGDARGQLLRFEFVPLGEGATAFDGPVFIADTQEDSAAGQNVLSPRGRHGAVIDLDDDSAGDGIPDFVADRFLRGEVPDVDLRLAGPFRL